MKHSEYLKNSTSSSSTSSTFSTSTIDNESKIDKIDKIDKVNNSNLPNFHSNSQSYFHSNFSSFNSFSSHLQTAYITYEWSENLYTLIFTSIPFYDLITSIFASGEDLVEIHRFVSPLDVCSNIIKYCQGDAEFKNDYVEIHLEHCRERSFIDSIFPTSTYDELDKIYKDLKTELRHLEDWVESHVEEYKGMGIHSSILEFVKRKTIIPNEKLEPIKDIFSSMKPGYWNHPLLMKLADETYDIIIENMNKGISLKGEMLYLVWELAKNE